MKYQKIKLEKYGSITLNWRVRLTKVLIQYKQITPGSIILSIYYSAWIAIYLILTLTDC